MVGIFLNKIYSIYINRIISGLSLPFLMLAMGANGCRGWGLEFLIKSLSS